MLKRLHLETFLFCFSVVKEGDVRSGMETYQTSSRKRADNCCKMRDLHLPRFSVKKTQTRTSSLDVQQTKRSSHPKIDQNFFRVGSEIFSHLRKLQKIWYSTASASPALGPVQSARPLGRGEIMRTLLLAFPILLLTHYSQPRPSISVDHHYHRWPKTLP